MVTFKGLIWTLKTVSLKNLWKVPFLFMGYTQTITFKGDPELKLRVNKAKLKAIRKELINGETLIGEIEGCPIALHEGIKYVIGDFSYIFDTIGRDYSFLDFKDKNVLDIGGYLGDTALLFLNWGAKDVVVYEPVKEHFDILKLNMKINNLDLEVYNKGIASYDGFIDVHYQVLGGNFGHPSHNYGPNSKRIEVVNINKVPNPRFDIAKFDCEGYEFSILEVSDNTLRGISAYIMEYHYNPKPLIKKFEGAGFKVDFPNQYNVKQGILRAILP